jgi:hypothetical protein
VRIEMAKRVFLGLAVVWAATVGVAWPDEAKPGSAAPPEGTKVESLGEQRYRLGGIEFHSGTREIRIPCEVNAKEGVLEYVLVHEQGKRHESLLVTSVSPFQLQIVLNLLRYRAGRGELFDALLPPGPPPPLQPRGEAVEVWVEWETARPHPVNGVILDQSTGEAMEPGPWIFNGSEVIAGKFQAEVEGSILALYRDPLAMFNHPNPRMTDDENWFPLGRFLPEIGHPVTLTLRPALSQEPEPKPKPKTP